MRPATSILVSIHMSDFITHNYTVLVVEDNDFIRAQIAGYLKGEGYNIAEASDGGQALEIFDNSIDLIILDVRMKPVGGFEFIKNIQGRGRKVPVVLLTGDQNNDLLEKASQYNIDIVMLKPVVKDRLISTVQRLLQRAQ